jgi:predicted acyl esterase
MQPTRTEEPRWPTWRIAVVLLWAACALASLGGCARYAGQSIDVSFASADGTRLQGTLVLPPDAAAPVPAIVLLHGAEPATRSMAYRMHANVFVERGIAVLLFDKRGAGESGGDHDQRRYGQLVEDALAALVWLERQPAIDRARLGLMGISESGWITPEIAERHGGLSVVINKSGPALAWPLISEWERYHEIHVAGASEASAREQAAVYRRLWAYQVERTADKRRALEAELRSWAGRKDSQLPAELIDYSDTTVSKIRYDPGPFLERSRTPMLYVYGRHDVNIPTRACVERLQALADLGRPMRHHVFEDEGHEIGGLRWWPPGYRFADGYAQLIGDFAVRHLALAAPQ